MNSPFYRKSPWLWVVLGPVILGVVAVGLGVLGMIGWFVLSKTITRTVVYREAIQRAELMAHHSTRLGPNSGAGDLIVGWVSPNAANFRVRYYGPKATSELRVRARRVDGRWRFDQLDLIWRETHGVEDLRTTEERAAAAG
jgi:hypothetical protein